MSRKRTIAAVVIVAIALILAGIAAFVVTVHPSVDDTYAEAASSVHAPPYTNVTNGQLALRVNNVSSASDPAMAEVWISLSQQISGSVYCRTLTPSPGEKNLIVNVTVTNTQRAPVSFSYTDFFIVSRDGRVYYANYAVCDRSCSAAALKNRTLNASFVSDLYVLFSVPTTAEPAKLVYASSPPIVVDLV